MLEQGLGSDYPVRILSKVHQCLDNHLQQYCSFRGDGRRDDSWVRHEIEKLRQTGIEDPELRHYLAQSPDPLREVLDYNIYMQSIPSPFEGSEFGNRTGNNSPRNTGPSQGGHAAGYPDRSTSAPDVMSGDDEFSTPTQLNHCIYWQEEEANGYLV
jgi:hypothetical protein